MSRTRGDNMSVIYKKQNLLKARKRSGGYSLLELAIVLTVAGLLLSGVGAAYAIYIKDKAITSTASNTNLAMNAISNYFIQNGKYPCPARLDAKRTDPDYGLPANGDENCADDTSIAPGTCAGGICIESSPRTIDVWDTSPCAVEGGTCVISAPTKVRYGLTSGVGPPAAREGTFSSNVACFHGSTAAFAPDPYVGTPKKCFKTLSSFTPRVRRGAVPFRLLNKQESMAYDGYNNKIEYAVTENMTKVTTYNKDQGGISVVDTQATPRSVVKDPATIHFIVLSHGEDGLGGYTNDGLQPLACGTGRDGENCNTSAANPTAVYAMGQISDGAGAQHFDDIVKYSSSVETPLWVVADAAGTDIKDAGLAPQLAIGHASSYTAADTLALDVYTHIRANDKIYTPSVCSPGSVTNCFPPSRVGGSDPNMDCKDPLNSMYDATKPYMIGISAGRAVCTDVPKVTCPTGQVMRGVTVSGTLICTAPPLSCPAQNVTVCTANDDSLPAATTGTVITTAVHGDSRTLTYTCLATGVWSLTGSAGICGCTAGVAVTTPPCTGYMSPVGSCWDGNVTVTATTTCGPYNVTNTIDTSACTCSDCAVAGSNGCTAPLLVATPSYPAGYSGSINYTRNWVCSTPSTGTFSGWTYVSDNCTCNPLLPLTETNVSCTITGCDATGVATLNGQYPCSAGFAGSGKFVNRYKNYTCPAATYDAAWTNTVNTCACTAVVKGQSIACPTGYSGVINQSATFDCVANSWGPWTNNLPGTPPSTCIPIEWKPQGSISGSGTSAIGFEAFTACSPVNSTASCWTPSGSGNPYNYYSVCKCQ